MPKVSDTYNSFYAKAWRPTGGAGQGLATKVAKQAFAPYKS